jgi:hypothetical protein
MLYKLGETNGNLDKIQPVPFQDFSSFGKLEKDLENLFARNILEMLFEDGSLMPIFQERSYQEEADIYALDVRGDLSIFELKRSTATGDAVHQALRYAQSAGQWSYATLQGKYRQYTADAGANLREAHRQTFGLEHPLDERQMNERQNLILIGSAADDTLMNAVAYWRRQRLSIQFLPYRIYEFGGEKYLEFFAPPVDKHQNPADVKGVFLNTNRKWNEDHIWYMMENKRAAAFGDASRFVRNINSGDVVFFYHNRVGVVAAARVKKGNVRPDVEETLFRDVDFLTPVPTRGREPRGMPQATVSEIIGRGVWWAHTMPTTYLSKAEADNLVTRLNDFLSQHEPRIA